jgi:hypothetical protein
MVAKAASGTEDCLGYVLQEHTKGDLVRDAAQPTDHALIMAAMETRGDVRRANSKAVVVARSRFPALDAV